MSNTNALVLGATGGIGGEVARRLVARGWAVRALHRGPENLVRADSRFQWVRGDAMSREDVSRAADGTSLIVHAVNPPGYRNWPKLVLPMLDNTIAAAEAVGARVLLPGTVYNYGPEVFPHVGEDAPQAPRTTKGRIRAEMERRLAAMAAEGPASALIVRSGDYFGPEAASSWFSAMVPAGRRPRVVRYPGAPGVGHQWAYLPDVAETMVQLLQRGDLPAFARFHMAGQWDADGTLMTGAIQRALGEPRVPVRRFPWLLARLASPFNGFLREVMEMKYLWEAPLRLKNNRLLAVLGEEPHTPLDAAVEQTLRGIGAEPM